MPARRLDDQAMHVARYDVAGHHSEAEPQFVRHVGLTDEDRDVRLDDEVLLAHMVPPFQLSGNGCTIQSAGSAGLSSGDIEQIRVFLEDLDLEFAATEERPWEQYVICPHVREPDNAHSCRRFNCGGLVVEAYRIIELDILVTAMERLPLVSLETLIQAYPDQERRLRRPKPRNRMGLVGEGPWPVLLSGYVLNALDRPDEEIRAKPTLPRPGDEYFPSRAIREEVLSIPYQPLAGDEFFPSQRPAKRKRGCLLQALGVVIPKALVEKGFGLAPKD